MPSVRGSDGEQEVYICLFTCAVSRAAHLEIVDDLTLECFFAGFQKVHQQISTRSHNVGQCYHLYS